MDISRVLKLGPARRVDPGLGSVLVEVKTCLGVGSVKPDRLGGSTRSNPCETRPIFLILAVIEPRRFDLLKGQNTEKKRSNIEDSCKPN